MLYKQKQTTICQTRFVTPLAGRTLITVGRCTSIKFSQSNFIFLRQKCSLHSILTFVNCFCLNALVTLPVLWAFPWVGSKIVYKECDSLSPLTLGSPKTLIGNFLFASLSLFTISVIERQRGESPRWPNDREIPWWPRPSRNSLMA